MQRRGCDHDRTLVSRYGWGGPVPLFRPVGESITIATLFTTLKYYPNNPALFQERALRYAHTIPCPADSVLVFEYVSIHKAADRFQLVPPTAGMPVIPHRGSGRTAAAGVSAGANGSCGVAHLRATQPGSYAPAA